MKENEKTQKVKIPKNKTQKNKAPKNKTLKNKVPKNKKIKFSQKHPRISLTIRIFLLLFLAFIVIAAGIVVGMIYGMWGQDFEINEEELTMAGNSVIYDIEGNVLAELSGDENRKVITMEEMAKYLPEAYVAIEDERFYEHSGVDFKRTGGAIFNYVIHRGSSSYGGSTITQQIVKNITGDDANSGAEGITRKIKEWAKAYQIERMLSKDQILELYLNVIFVGSGNYGVQVGSEYYFNKDAKDLSLEECAFLAGINNAPNLYNPYAEGKEYGDNEDKTNKINTRTKTVLGKMHELEYITQEEYDDACKNVEKGLKFKKGNQKTMIYSYHTDATIAQVINDFQKEKGWSKEYATTYAYGGGLKIYSTEDPDVQKTIEKQMVDNLSAYQTTSRLTKDSDGVYVKSQSAMVVIDNETGYVSGVVGGLGEKTTSRGLNRATQSLRQTGSSIKPIADVLPALEEGLVTASTRYQDLKTKFNKGTYSPKNDGNSYLGNISLRVAIAKSHNIPFVKIMAEMTPIVSTTYLKKMGITSLDDEKDVGLSLAIGGLTNGISPLEMAGAYATIANDGVYRTPLFYIKIVDNNGDTVLEPVQETTRVCSEQNAYILKDLLKSVTKSGGTAPYCAITGFDVAAKTGTTNADKDRWLCGFTNYYTAATWYGFDEPEEVHYSNGNPSGRIWAAVMKDLHKDKTRSTFTKPSGIISVKVCSETGLKATKKCKATYSEIFAEDNIPDYCDEGDSAVEICEDSELLATRYCPNVITKYFSYILPKEKLNLWTTSKSYTKAPTEVCTEHNEDGTAETSDLPTIKLVGKAKITLNVGDNYSEQGATAKDATDGDLTNNITVSGSVNTSKEGTYTITYKVTNSLGKEATATRTIIVKDNSTDSTSTNKPGANSNTVNDENTTSNPKNETSNANTSATEEPAATEPPATDKDKPEENTQHRAHQQQADD